MINITSTKKESDKETENIVRRRLTTALNRFSKKHRTDTEEIVTVVDHVVYRNKDILHKIHDNDPLCLNARNSHLTRGETYFELMDITIHSKYVEIGYEVFVMGKGDVFHLEKIKR